MALVAIGVVIFGYSFMSGKRLFDSSKKFYAIYDDIDGLSKSSTVTINGMKVGTVSDVKFLDNSGKILVDFRIDSDFNFSKNSVAEIYSDGLIGGKALRIIPKTDGNEAQSEDTLVSSVEKNVIAGVTDRLDPIRKKVNSSLGEIDTLVKGVNEVLDDKRRADLRETISNLNATVKNINNTTSELNTVIAGNSTKIDNAINDFSATASNVSKFSDSLAQIEVKPLVTKLDSVLNDFQTISTKIESGEGTAGKLVNDDSMYRNMERATKQIEELVEDMKLNPDRYIDLRFSLFGRKNKTKPYKKPKD